MAIDLSQLPTGTVTGVFGAAGPDGADTDRAPDGYAATGTFTFTPSVGYLKTTSPSQRIELLPLTATIDANGNLVDVKNPTIPGLVLTATDSPIATAANLQWTVTAANLQAVLSTRNFDPVTITVPTGGTVDLIQAIPVLKAAFTATQPVGVPQGGTTGQVLAKNSATDFDTKWVAASSGDGTVTSANITDATPTGRSVITATNAAAVATAAGLGNVNNTSDANKPVSTAQATAIAGLISDSAATTDTTHTWSVSKINTALANAGGTGIAPAVKSVDESRTSSTVTTADSDLKLTLSTGTYEYEARLFVFTTTVANIAFGISGWNTISGWIEGENTGQTAATTTAGAPRITRFMNSQATMGASYAGGVVGQFGGLTAAGTAAGSFTSQLVRAAGRFTVTGSSVVVSVNWKQGTSSTDPTTVGAGSTFIVAKVG